MAPALEACVFLVLLDKIKVEERSFMKRVNRFQDK
jgi:hypothetical protein